MKPQSRTFRIALTAAGFAVVLGVFAATGYYYARFASLSPSESAESLAVREAMAGRVPCRDFAFTDMPLAPYLSGVLSEIAGSGLIARRVSNLAVAALGLMLVVAGMRRRFGAFEPGLAAAFAAAASPAWICLQAQGTNDVWSGFFLSAAFAAAVGGWPFLPRLIVFAASASLAVANDLMLAPTAAVLAAAAVMELDTAKRKLTFGLAAALGLAALPAASFLLTGANGVYFNWTYQWQAEPETQSIILGFDWWRVSPGALLILATGIFGIAALVKARRQSEITLLAAALLAISMPIVSTASVGYAIAPAVPVVAAAGAAALWSSPGALQNHFRHVVWVLPAVAFVYPLPTMTEDDADREVVEVARAINENAGKGPVLTPLGIVAVAADRKVLKGTERGVFSLMADENSRLAERVNMTTLEKLADSVKDREAAAVVTVKDPFEWNFNLQVPGMVHQPYKDRRKLDKALKRGYRAVYASDTMEVMIPKE